jgi:hypothetical protein
MDAKSIRQWCLQVPRPKLIRVHCGDDTTQEVKAPRNGQSWAQVATTIAALQPTLLEAFGDDGDLIRATRDGDDDDDDDKGRASTDVDLPALLSSDPETARLTHFANLLYRSHRFATEVAFERMAQLFDRLDSRSASIEQRLERAEANHRRAVQQQIDDAFDQADALAQAAAQQQQQGAPADPRQAMLEMFINNAVAGWMQRNQGGPPPPPPPPNGKPNGGKS